MKKYFQASFSEDNKVQYWDTLYDQDDFFGECVRQRMNCTFSWLDSLGLPQNTKILDVGCGAGRPAYEAIKRGYTVFGIDFSFEMLLKANSILNSKDQTNAQLCRGDIESLPYQDASFDAIICLGVITYLQSEKKVLSELERVLKPNGVLALSIINKARLVRLMDVPILIRNVFRKTLVKKGSHQSNGKKKETNHALSTYLIPDIYRSLEQAGFTVCGYKTVPLEPLTLFDHAVLPRSAAMRMAQFVEQFTNVPVVGSFGGMCIFKAKKGHSKTSIT